MRFRCRSGTNQENRASYLAAVRRLLITLFFLMVVSVPVDVSALFCSATLHVKRQFPGSMDFYQRRFPAADWQAVSLAAWDHAQLRAWFIRPRQHSEGCVIVLHGISDSRSGGVGFAPMFLERGYAVLAPDSRAHGESGGELVTYGLLERYDTVDWAHWLLRSGCSRLYGLGESLGASVLIEATALEPVFRAAAAESAYSDLPAIAESRLPTPALLSNAIVRGGMAYAYVRFGLDFAQTSPLQAIAITTTPILLIHGLQDEKTSPLHSRALAAANTRAVLWLVPNAGHTGAASAAPLEFRQRVLAWFAAH